jgi:hypothetical protein
MRVGESVNGQRNHPPYVDKVEQMLIMIREKSWGMTVPIKTQKLGEVSEKLRKLVIFRPYKLLLFGLI